MCDELKREIEEAKKSGRAERRKEKENCKRNIMINLYALCPAKLSKKVKH